MSCAYDPWGESTGVLVASRQRRSRKAHRCAECQRIIDRGEIYSNERWRFHDGLVEYKIFAACRLEELTPRARMTVCGLIDGMWREG